jgi:hypothetical protein
MRQDQYPIQFSVDYPDRPLDRVSTAFRILLAIPIFFVLATVSGGEVFEYTGEAGRGTFAVGRGTFAAGGGIILLGPLLMILFRQKYPRWWFDWNLQLSRFTARVLAYLALMDDKYPSTDEEQSVHLDFPYPDVPNDLNRWLPLVKWLLAIPHYIVLIFLSVASVVAVIAAWLAILLTGTYPRGIFDFVEGVFRWENRVYGYAFLLVTDRYPPFSLKP